MKVLIIIPSYNEEGNIENVIKRINDYRKKSKYDVDYILINDGSTDDSYNIIKKNKYNSINLVNNLGIGGAVQTGYLYAYYNAYDIAIQFDGDGQHDEKYLDNLIQSIIEGNDMVIGSRFIEDLSKFKSSKMRRIGIKIISEVIKLFTRKKIYDVTSGYRACNKKIIEKFAKNYPLEYPEPETLSWLLINKYKVNEIPVEMNERVAGKSSIRPLHSCYYMFSVIISIIITCLNKGEK